MMTKKKDGAEKATKAELAAVDRNLANLVDFTAKHGHDNSVQACLDTLETERDALLARMSTTKPTIDRLPDIIPDAQRRYPGTVFNLGNLPTTAEPRRIAQLKTAIGKIFGDIPLHPQYDEGPVVAQMALNQKALALFDEPRRAGIERWYPGQDSNL